MWDVSRSSPPATPREALSYHQLSVETTRGRATLAITATKPLTHAAEYLSGLANYATSALTEAANKSIRENKLLVFGPQSPASSLGISGQVRSIARRLKRRPIVARRISRDCRRDMQFV